MSIMNSQSSISTCNNIISDQANLTLQLSESDITLQFKFECPPPTLYEAMHMKSNNNNNANTSGTTTEYNLPELKLNINEFLQPILFKLVEKNNHSQQQQTDIQSKEAALRTLIQSLNHNSSNNNNNGIDNEFKCAL